MEISAQENTHTRSEPLMEQDAAVDHKLDVGTGLQTGSDGNGDPNAGQLTTTVASEQKNAETQKAIPERHRARVSLDKLQLDDDIYGRTSVDQATIAKYFEALLNGDTFPPIVVEKGTNRVLDGWHRVKAKQRLRERYDDLVKAVSDDPLVFVPQSEIETIECEYHEIPLGLSPRVYGFRFNLKHGKPATDDDCRKVAREWYQMNKGATYEALARDLGIHPTTVKRHVSDLVKEFEEKKKTTVLQLNSEGLSQQEIVTRVKAQYPKARISQPLVSTLQKAAKKKETETVANENDDVVSRTVGSDTSGGNEPNATTDAQDSCERREKPTDDLADRADAGPSCQVEAEDSAPVEEDGFNLIETEDHDSWRVTGIQTLPEPLRPELKSRLSAVVSEIRSKSLEMLTQPPENTEWETEIVGERYTSADQIPMFKRDTPTQPRQYVRSVFANPPGGRFTPLY
ncbi:MAG: hypothetical protein ACLQPD_21130 [Desulfomonilaceae bacterium]